MQRFMLNFILVLLFAFAQMGAATHEISHFNQAPSSQSNHQPDQNNLDDTCGQCLSFAQAAGGVAPTGFSFSVPPTQTLAIAFFAFFTLAFTRFYQLARAPPAL